MYRKISTAGAAVKPDTIAVALFDDQKKLPKAYSHINEQFGGQLADLIARPEYSAEIGSLNVLYNHTSRKKATPRLIVLGFGRRDKFNADTLRIASARLVKQLSQAKLSTVSIDIASVPPDSITPSEAGRAIGEGLAIGDFSFDDFRETQTNGQLKIAAETNLKKAIAHGLKVGEAVNTARKLAATPPNVANPKYLVGYCRKLARQHANLSVSVIDYARAKQLKMGGLTAVGQGSNTPPALICMEYKPSGRSAKSKKSRGAAGKTFGGGPVMLVGKAVTFDTGGYSLKPTASMLGMKYDKCGGMAVIATLAAVAELKLPVHVVGLIPAAENMVDRDAYRPSDILRMYNGVTVEVTNTDAEGRLILADALAYGYEKYKPAAVIDIATLTGGVNYALGSWAAGLMGNNEKLLQKLQAAGEASGDKLWHLPLIDEHRDTFKSIHADIVNSAGKGSASSSMGAAFLSYFIDDVAKKQMPKLPWAHLDIASMASVDADTPLFARGPTGFGVRLMVRLLEEWGSKI